MNIISFVVGLVIFSLILAGIFWVSFYIVLPLVLLVLVISFGTSLIKNFIYSSEQREFRKNKKNIENQVIDVEFEEIK